jgi:hypothetical protein
MTCPRLDLRENGIVALPDALAELPARDRLDLRWNGFPTCAGTAPSTRRPWSSACAPRGCVVWLRLRAATAGHS